MTNIDPKLLAKVQEIAARLVTQDNRATDCPIFIVQEKRRVYGFDPAYSDKVAWINSDGDEADSEEHARLEAEYEETYEEPEGWTRTAFEDEWHYVTACFTEAGCDEYIQRNRHNHRGELRSYAASSYRNDEFRVVRDFLLAIGGGAK